jgi:hypothetical protein
MLLLNKLRISNALNGNNPKDIGIVTKNSGLNISAGQVRQRGMVTEAVIVLTVVTLPLGIVLRGFWLMYHH